MARLEDAEAVKLAAEAFSVYSGRAALNFEDLEKFWSQLPSRIRKSSRLIALHALALNTLGRGAQAATEIRSALKKDWDEELVLAYGSVEASDPVKQLKQAERWLKAHSEDGALLLTAARLCMAVELWGKARSYLESSLAMSPRTDAYALYGRLLNQLGEDEGAALAFRSGLAMVTGAVDEVPALDAPTTVTASAENEAAGAASAEETA